MRLKRTMAPLVWITGLLSAGHDRIPGRYSARPKNCRLNLNPKALRGENATSPSEDVPRADLGDSKHFERPLHPLLSDSGGLSHQPDLLSGLDLTFGTEHSLHRAHHDAALLELVGKSERKIRRHQRATSPARF
jgi:hypothetical protein